MNYTIENIIDFLKDLAGVRDIQPNSDINEEVGVYGDDFHEMIEKYSKRFSVNMDSYLWYFHTQEEGSNSIGGSFFKPPNERVTRIPVTPLMLLGFANKGKWEMNYPEHTLPKRRYDLIINTILVFTLLLALIISLIFKYFLN